MEKEKNIKVNNGNDVKFTDTILKNDNNSLDESVKEDEGLEYFTE